MTTDDLVKMARTIVWGVHDSQVPAHRAVLRLSGLDEVAIDAALEDLDLRTDAAVGEMCRKIRAD
jgi:hypothetical protein